LQMAENNVIVDPALAKKQQSVAQAAAQSAASPAPVMHVNHTADDAEIPDLRDPAQRERWRNDRRCTDPAVAGDQLIPSYSKGNPEIPAEIYAGLRAKLEADWAKEKEQKKQS
ncbi:MAG: hypothetical protein IKD72_00355, partial [Clostridia bacterium]|nr:hypothetical protein [Clostridia bacterium]